MLLVDDHQPELLELRRRPAPARGCRRRAGWRRTRPRASCSRRAAPLVDPVSSATRKRDACSSREMFMKCCSARISVGAMNATCRPFSIATSAASSATIVLPAPTSPCSSRFIGCGALQVVDDLLQRLLLARRSAGTAARRAPTSRMRSSTRTVAGFCFGRGGLPPREHAHLKEERFLEDQPLLRRRREPVQRLDRRVVRRKMRRRAAPHSATACRAARAPSSGSGSGRSAGSCCSASCTSRRCIFGVTVPVFS